MLESYDDTGGCAAAIICLVGLIVFTIGTIIAYLPDSGRIERGRTECGCTVECGRTVESEHK